MFNLNSSSLLLGGSPTAAKSKIALAFCKGLPKRHPVRADVEGRAILRKAEQLAKDSGSPEILNLPEVVALKNKLGVE